MEIIALWHSEETKIFGFWGVWLVFGVLGVGVALLGLVAYLVKNVGRRKD